MIRLDTLVPKPLTWLWYPRLPAGRLSLLVGHPDRGKSLIACDFTAHLTQPRSWPDQQPCPHGTVLFLESEDSLDETVVPRLQAAGADLTRVFTYQHRHLLHLPGLIKELSPKLVVVSPLNTYLPRINTWADQDVRHVLQPFADLAAKSGATILGLMHPPKSKQSLPIHAVVGSVAFGAVARSILAVERGDDGLYTLELVKHNLSEPSNPLGYRIQASSTHPDVGRIMWESAAPPPMLMIPDAERSALAEACDYLRMALSDGPVSTTAIIRGAEANGIAVRMLKDARRVLNVHAKQVFLKDKSYWELSLP